MSRRRTEIVVVRMAFHPGIDEGAGRNDLEPVAPGGIEDMPCQAGTDSPASEGIGDLGMDEGDDPRAAAVGHEGGRAVDGELVAVAGGVLGDLGVHAGDDLCETKL